MGCVLVKRVIFTFCRLPLLNFMPCLACSRSFVVESGHSAILPGYSNPILQLTDPFIVDGEHVRPVIRGIPSCSMVSAINFIADK